MTRRIEIFSAGCPVCEKGAARVRALAGDDDEIVVHDLHGHGGARRAAEHGIEVVPAVVVDGRLLACCRATGPTEKELRAAGVGQPAR